MGGMGTRHALRVTRHDIKMKLSTRSRYGLRLMVQLAQNYGKDPVSIKNICEEEELSEKYLSQLVIPLKNQGLVIPIRGAGGGYILGKKPEEITLKDIVEVFEGNIMLVSCTENEFMCNKTSECAAHKAWKIIGESISKTLSSLNLKKIIEMKEI